jgi:hypothetical protein
MGRGKLCIASAFGGNVDFMYPTNSLLIPCKTVDVTDDYFKGQWGSPDMDAAVASLRNASDSFYALSKSGFQTALNFSKARCIKQTLSALS